MLPVSPAARPATVQAFRLAGDPEVRVVLANVGLACCSMEVEAAIRTGLLLAEGASNDAASSTILLVSGTVTDALAPAVVRIHEDLGSSARIVAFGACASTGGPYWDAPTVTKGIDQLLDVSTYVPGCPPRPDALVAALSAMTREDRA
jgi:NADH-quinone oxidoreductase subunit B